MHRVAAKEREEVERTTEKVPTTVRHELSHANMAAKRTVVEVFVVKVARE